KSIGSVCGLFAFGLKISHRPPPSFGKSWLAAVIQDIWTLTSAISGGTFCTAVARDPPCTAKTPRPQRGRNQRDCVTCLSADALTRSDLSLGIGCNRGVIYSSSWGAGLQDAVGGAELERRRWRVAKRTFPCS